MRVLVFITLIFLACISGLGQNRGKVSLHRVCSIGEGIVSRTSEHKNEQGIFLPPWRKVEIANVGLDKRPLIGGKVTVVPLNVNIAPTDLRIAATQRGSGCDSSDPDIWWQVELEQVREKQFFEIAALPERSEEFPFDVMVIYPAVKFAREIKQNRLTKRMLPRGVAVKTVKGAVDLTNDGLPDMLLVKYCCRNPQQSPDDDCDYTCGKTFRKIKTRWKLIDTAQPC